MRFRDSFAPALALFVCAALAGPLAAETPPPPPAMPGTDKPAGERPPERTPPEKPAGDKAGEKPGERPGGDAVWSKTKVMVCEVLQVQNCRTGGCEQAAKLPSFRVDTMKHTMCGLVSGGCKGEIKIGQMGFDRSGTRLTLHAIGVAFVVGIDADGAMNGADIVRGRVVAIQGRCVPSQ